MPAIRDFGKGRVTVKNPTLLAPGEARDSLNLLHNHGDSTAKLRRPISRINATLVTPNAGSPVFLGLHEYVKADGSTKVIAKVGDSLLYTTISPTSAWTSFFTGLDSTHLVQMATANGFVFLADWAVKNYISDGTAGGTYELQKTLPTGVFTLASAGTATGNAAATIRYWYSDLDPATGMESPPSAPVSVARGADAGVTVTSSTLTFTAPYTQKNLYREKAGDPGAVFLVASGLTAVSFPYADTSLDTSLTTESEIHTDSGAAAIEKPEAAKHVCWHRGRIFLANLAGHPSRIRWSMPLEPTQFSNDTGARWDLAADDGQEITGMVSFNGALVIFKTNSIHVMNGDVDESMFTFFPAVVGNGCVAMRTIAVWPDAGIFFLGRCGVYIFDMQSAKPAATNILPDLDLLDPAYRDYYSAGIDPCNRLYMLSATPTGSTRNKVTHVLNVDTGAWGRFEFCAGFVTPTFWSPSTENGQVRNYAGTVKGFFGDALGFLYETDVAFVAANTYPQGDGMVAGQTVLVPTAATATTTTFGAGAAVFNAGSKCVGLSLTVVRAADGSIESRIITAQSGTFVLTHAAWTGATPTTADLCFIGAYAAYLALGRMDLDATARKRWRKMFVEFQKQVSSVAVPLANQQIPVWLGYILDSAAAPLDANTATDLEKFTPPFGAKSISTYNGVRDRVVIQRRAVSMSPFVYMMGVGHSLELLLLEIEGYPLGSTVSPE